MKVRGFFRADSDKRIAHDRRRAPFYDRIQKYNLPVLPIGACIPPAYSQVGIDNCVFRFRGRNRFWGSDGASRAFRRTRCKVRKKSERIGTMRDYNKCQNDTFNIKSKCYIFTTIEKSRKAPH